MGEMDSTLPEDEELDDAIARAENLLEQEPENSELWIDLAGFYRAKGAVGIA